MQSHTPHPVPSRPSNQYPALHAPHPLRHRRHAALERRRGARAKLGAAGIDFDRFRVNAFGSDHEHRPMLPAVAQHRMREAFGHDVRGDRVVIIGDTPADIACGRDIGARAIAVATGRYGIDELRAHEPAAVFADLSDTDAVVGAVLAA